MIAELISQFWPLILAGLTLLAGLFAGHTRATAKADAKVQAAQAGQAAAEQKASQATRVTEQILAETQNRNKTNAEVAAADADAVRSELHSEWERKD